MTHLHDTPLVPSDSLKLTGILRILTEKIPPYTSAQIEKNHRMEALAQEVRIALEPFLTDPNLEQVIQSGRDRALIILDLCLLEAALINGGEEELPEELTQMTDKFTAPSQHPPSLTYEDIILVNPFEDRRLFMKGEDGEQEAFFYQSHTQIECAAYAGLIPLFEFHALLMQDEAADFEDQALSLLHKSLQDFERVQALTVELYDKLSPESFNRMRPYFMGNRYRQIPGPSGLYSAAFPAFDRLVMGKERGDINKSIAFYPTGIGHDYKVATVKTMDKALDLMKTSASLRLLTSSRSPKLQRALEAIIEKVKAFRIQHKNLILKFIPEMRGGGKGSGGMKDPLGTLETAISDMKTAAPIATDLLETIPLATDYNISRVIRGGWQLSLGHSGEIKKEAALKGLMEAFRAGITTFDCADIYTGVEELYGEFRRKVAQEYGGEAAAKIQFHTKFVPDQDALSALDGGSIEAIIDRSLRRLGVDRLNLVQFHWWDYEVPGMIEAAKILQSLQEKGKIGHIGLTNFNAQSTQELLEAGIPIVSTQVQYSLLDRRPERSLVPLCQEYGVQLLCYGTVAGGFLSDQWLGKLDPGFTQEDFACFENRSLIKYRLIIEEIGGWVEFQKLLNGLKSLAQKHNTDIATIASAAVLRRPQVAGIIVGGRNAEHTRYNGSIAQIHFDAEDEDRLNQLLATHLQIQGDVFDLERNPESLHARIMRTNLNAQQ